MRRGNRRGVQQRLRIIGGNCVAKLRCLRENAGGVSVCAHAEHQHVGLLVMLQGEDHGLFDIVQAAFGGVVVNHRQPLCLRGLVLQQVLADQLRVAVGMLHGHDAFVHQRDADAPPVQVFRVERLKKGDG